MKQLNYIKQYKWGSLVMAILFILNIPFQVVIAQNLTGNSDGMAGQMKLQTFDANSGFDSNILFWVTSAGMNAAYFIVEKSRDGREFQNAGIVLAGENNKLPQQYQWADLNPFPATFYRLISVDKEGNQGCSKMVKLNRNEEGLRISPTIIRDHINFYAERPMPKVKIDILELSGKSVAQQTVSIDRE